MKKLLLLAILISGIAKAQFVEKSKPIFKVNKALSIIKGSDYDRILLKTSKGTTVKWTDYNRGILENLLELHANKDLIGRVVFESGFKHHYRLFQESPEKTTYWNVFAINKDYNGDVKFEFGKKNHTQITDLEMSRIIKYLE